MSDQYHYKMEESEAGEYPLYHGGREVGTILFYDEAKDVMRGLTAVGLAKAAQLSAEEDVSYEVIQDDQPVAGATTLQETLNYAAQYLQDGPVEIVEVRRTVINKLEKAND